MTKAKDFERRGIRAEITSESWRRNTIVKDIHTEFRALNIEVPTTVEKNTEAFASFLGDLSDERETKESKGPADR